MSLRRSNLFSGLWKQKKEQRRLQELWSNLLLTPKTHRNQDLKDSRISFNNNYGTDCPERLSIFLPVTVRLETVFQRL